MVQGNEGRIEMEEVKRALKTLKNGKVVGTYNIIGQFFKSGRETIKQVIILQKKLLREGRCHRAGKRAG